MSALTTLCSTLRADYYSVVTDLDEARIPTNQTKLIRVNSIEEHMTEVIFS